MTVAGIDISLYQPTTPNLAGLGFVMVKATQGVSIIDPKWASHAADVRRAGLILGAYHYWEAGDGAAQAAAFLAVGGSASLLAIDLEGSGSGTDAAHAQVRDFIGAVHGAGRLVGLYHSESGYPDLGQDWRWVADWAVAAPAIPWDMHQYRGAPLDLDRWRGDAASLAALAGGRYVGGTMALYLATARTGTVKVAAGFATHGLLPGDPWSVVKSVTGPLTMHYDQRISRAGGTTTPTNAVRCVDGPLAGLYLGLGGTNVAATDDPTPAVLTAADVDAARAAGFADAKNKAESAVQSI